MGASLGWHKYVGDEGAVIAIDTFGASAPGDTVMQEFGFTEENVVATCKNNHQQLNRTWRMFHCALTRQWNIFAISKFSVISLFRQ